MGHKYGEIKCENHIAVFCENPATCAIAYRYFANNNWHSVYRALCDDHIKQLAPGSWAEVPLDEYVAHMVHTA